MKPIISAEAIKSSDLSFDSIISYASTAGVIAAGMIVAHSGLKLIKMQDKAIANIGVAAVGLVGAIMIENPWVKLGMIGLAAYGAINALAIGVKEVTAPANTGAGGLSGFIPETIKSKIRNFIPTIGSIGDFDDVRGYTEGTEEVREIGDLDEPIRGPEDFSGTPNELMGEEKVEGLGEAAPLLM